MQTLDQETWKVNQRLGKSVEPLTYKVSGEGRIVGRIQRLKYKSIADNTTNRAILCHIEYIGCI